MCIHGYTKQNMFYELQDVFMYEMYLYSRFRWNVQVERIYNGRWDEIMLPRVKTAFQGGFNPDRYAGSDKKAFVFVILDLTSEWTC